MAIAIVGVIRRAVTRFAASTATAMGLSPSVNIMTSAGASGGVVGWRRPQWHSAGVKS